MPLPHFIFSLRTTAFRVLLGFALLASVSSVFGASLTARFDRNVINLGDTAALMLTFQDASTDSWPNLPPIPGLTLQPAGRYQHFSMINGQTTKSLTLRYEVAAQKTGDFVIPPITVIVDGHALQSQSAMLKVLPRGQEQPVPDEVRKQAFVRMQLPKQEVYVGEVFPFEVQLFFQNAQNLQMPQLLSDGFTIGKTAPPQQTRTAINNAVYNVIIFRMTAVAYKTGELTFGPAECALSLPVPSTRTDPFDVFGGRPEMRRVTLSSDPYKVHVLPLPTNNVPASFTGAIGKFQMSFAAQPTNLNAGDPIVLKIGISGSGNFDSLKLPSLDAWHDFKIYPATSTVEIPDPLGIQGQKTFEQVVTPQNGEVHALPEFAFTYFDPDQKAYLTARQAPIPLTIRSSNEAAAQPVVLATGVAAPVNPVVSDLVHIKPSLGMLSAPAAPWVQRPWFMLLGAAPLGLWLALWSQRRRLERFNADPRLQRQRRLKEFLTENLPQLDSLAQAGEGAKFFDLAFRVLQEQLGERLDLPSSSITESVLEDRLRPAGTDAALVTALHELFQACNTARFAPQTDRRELATLAAEVRRVVEALQQLPDPKS